MKRTLIDRVIDSFLASVAAMLLLHALSPGTIEVPVPNQLQGQPQPAEEQGPSFYPFA